MENHVSSQISNFYMENNIPNVAKTLANKHHKNYKNSKRNIINANINLDELSYDEELYFTNCTFSLSRNGERHISLFHAHYNPYLYFENCTFKNIKVSTVTFRNSVFIGKNIFEDCNISDHLDIDSVNGIIFIKNSFIRELKIPNNMSKQHLKPEGSVFLENSVISNNLLTYTKENSNSKLGNIINKGHIIEYASANFQQHIHTNEKYALYIFDRYQERAYRTNWLLEYKKDDHTSNYNLSKRMFMSYNRFYIPGQPKSKDYNITLIKLNGNSIDELKSYYKYQLSNIILDSDISDNYEKFLSNISEIENLDKNRYKLKLRITDESALHIISNKSIEPTKLTDTIFSKSKYKIYNENVDLADTSIVVNS